MPPYFDTKSRPIGAIGERRARAGHIGGAAAPDGHPQAPVRVKRPHFTPFGPDGGFRHLAGVTAILEYERVPIPLDRVVAARTCSLPGPDGPGNGPAQDADRMGFDTRGTREPALDRDLFEVRGHRLAAHVRARNGLSNDEDARSVIASRGVDQDPAPREVGLVLDQRCDSGKQRQDDCWQEGLGRLDPGGAVVFHRRVTSRKRQPRQRCILRERQVSHRAHDRRAVRGVTRDPPR